MAFTASTFIYNDIPSDFFGLYLYSFDNKSQSNGSFGGEGDILEKRIQSKYRPLHYGVVRNKPLEFTLVFGTLGSCPIDRIEASKIAEWLIGHQNYKWLYICQPDMEHVRYRCLMDNLVQIPVGGNTFAFQVDVKCDSPYAYLIPEEIDITSTQTATKLYVNKSNINREYYPDMQIIIGSGTREVKIWTDREPERQLILSGVFSPGDIVVSISGENQTISGEDINWYEHFNLKFLRLWPGRNNISVQGNCTVKINCQPPINIGY